MFKKAIFVVIIIAAVTNVCFAVQPQQGKWDARGAVNFSFTVPANQTLTTTFVWFTYIIIRGEWATLYSTGVTLTIDTLEGKIFCSDPKIEGVFDTKTTARGTVKDFLVGLGINIDGTWTASCEEPLPNASPVLLDITDQTIEEGKTFTSIKLDDYVADPDNQDSEIIWNYAGNTKLNVSIDTNRVATITISNPEWNGNETITFTATDPGGLSDSDSAKLTVEKVWLLEGRLVPYTSICDLPKELSPLIATIVAITEVKVDLVSCNSLAAESQHPLGLVVRMFNSSSSTRGFTIPFPSDVIVHSDSLSTPALALYWSIFSCKDRILCY